MSKDQIQRLIGHGEKSNRVKDDFYPTPEIATIELLKREKFDGEVWEPACGDGAISEKFKQYGYNVYSTDLIDRNYGDDHFDFLKSFRPAENIVTNPPFNIGTKFTIHALKLASKKVVLFNKLTFLEGKERRDKLFCYNHLKTVYIFSERLAFGNHKGGMLAFAWYVFDKSYDGKPSLEWI